MVQVARVGRAGQREDQKQQAAAPEEVLEPAQHVAPVGGGRDEVEHQRARDEVEAVGVCGRKWALHEILSQDTARVVAVVQVDPGHGLEDSAGRDAVGAVQRADFERRERRVLLRELQLPQPGYQQLRGVSSAVVGLANPAGQLVVLESALLGDLGGDVVQASHQLVT